MVVMVGPKTLQWIGLAALALPVAVVTAMVPAADQGVIAVAAAAGLGAGLLTWLLIPGVKQLTLKAGLKGRDLGKKGTALEDKEV